MKKIFLMLLVISVNECSYAQPIANQDFSLWDHIGNNVNSCSNDYLIGPTGWGGTPYGVSLENPDMQNWFRVAGDPSVVTLSGSKNDIHMQTYGFTISPVTGSVLNQIGPGIVAIAAHYPFIKGGCYTITVNASSYVAECSNMLLDVWAASGLSATVSPPCVSPSISTTSFQHIGSHVSTSPETFVNSAIPLSPMTFTATSDNNELLIFIKDQSPCSVTRTLTSPAGTATTNGMLAINISSITVSTPCDGKCIDDLFLKNKSSDIAGGGVIEHAGIKIGSGVAPGGDPIINAPMDKETEFLGRWVKIEDNLNAQVNSGKFFEAMCTSLCDQICSLDPIQISPVESAGPDDICSADAEYTFSDADGGGTWSSSEPLLGINPSTGFVAYVSESIPIGENITITYTLGSCTVQKVVHVISCGAGRLMQNATQEVHNNFNREINIYPNPAQSTINIVYPCSSSGQMSIVIQDIRGRTLYKEAVDCNEGGAVQQSVDISSFVQGVYTVNLTMNDQHVVKKFVKL